MLQPPVCGSVPGIMNKIVKPDDYSDIIDHPHFQSKTHPQMSLYDRAAQFAPFAALVGYDSAVKEAERVTDQQIFLDEDALTHLDEKLTELSEIIDEKPEIHITYFVPDDKKDGGTYKDIYGKLQKIDTYDRALVLVDGRRISVKNIVEIE